VPCPQAPFDDEEHARQGQIRCRTRAGRALAIHWLVCPAAECPGIDAGCPPGFLSPAERAAFARLTFAKRRREWLLGRWTAKHLLQFSQHLHPTPSLDAVTVGNDPDGAPYLSVAREGRLPLSLSISHREERAFCALLHSPLPASSDASSAAVGAAIGADVERIEPRAPAFVRDFFTPGEARRVWACSPARRDTMVTVLWSAKEAVLKALRHGLRVDTRSVEIYHVAGIEDDLARAEAGDLAPVPWHTLDVRCALPGAGQLAAWWRPDGPYVLTLAVSCPEPIDCPGSQPGL
jgi:4'-phosphopantetheinyl transferase